MTGTKLWRISLAAILGFGWLFLTPAYSNDPLSLAFEEINQLKSKSQNLNYKTDLLELISISEEKYYTAESFKSIFEESFALYNAAVEQNNIAIQEKNSAQIAVNNQISIVSEAQNNLDIASINLTTTQVQYPVQGTPGLNAYLYDCWTPSGSYNNSPPLGCNTNPISMGPWINMSWNFGGGGPAGLYDDYQIRLSGYIKQTQHWTPQFRTCGDDGMTISINGNVVVNDWYDRGGGCGISNGYYMNSNEWVPIEIWWYENGGGANGNAQWNIGNGFVTIPSSVLSTEIPYIAPELIAAQENYNNKLSIYNQEVQILQTLQSNLTLAEQNLTLTEQNLTSSLTAKNNAETDYNNAIIDLNNSIGIAWEYYYSQLQRELQIAISQALNNQPKPEITPEPNTTIEPSPEPEPTIAPSPNPTPQPSPEQSEPVVPTPEPSSDTTNEPKPEPSSDPQPTPEPSQEPSPQPTDIGPSPSPEPEPTPDKPSSKPAQPNNITEETANLIADLTNKDTLTKLNSEQKAAVAEVLGIKSEEIATIVELAKTNEAVAKALEEFSDRAEENVDAPMPYTLADATTEIAAEQFLSNPIGAITNIDLDKVLSPSEWGKDMTDDQREKAQEVIVPVIIASNLVAAAMTRRI